MKDDDKNQPTGGYEVGYCKPPKDGQFKKGQSGNPSGRPRRLPDAERRADREQMQRDVLGLLERDIPLLINGKKITVATAELLLLKLIEKAKNGDFRSIRLVLTLWEKFASERGNAKAMLMQHVALVKDKMLHDVAKEPDEKKKDKIIEDYCELMDSDYMRVIQRQIDEPRPQKRY